MKIYTSYYGNIRNFAKEGIVPVRISLGSPKFIKMSMLSMKMLAPTGSMLGLEYDKYKERYIERLKVINWKIVFQILRDNSRGQPIALLCYESLKTEGEWCHRTMLAEYLNANHKELFGEITEYRKPENKETKSNQIDMFDGK